jgi:sugar phosphate isomerase/epimerase
MVYSRRQFGKTVLASIPMASVILASGSRLFAAAKPDSKFNGVQIGVIAPYSFHNMPSDAQSILDDLVGANLSAVEMQNTTVELFAGAPLPTGRGGARGRGPLTPEQIAARKAAAQGLSDWRVAASMDKYQELRKMYADAGVWIYGFKVALDLDMPDAEYDYAFNVARALGCNQVTMEMPTDANLTQRVGQFATKHKIMVGYHEHTQASPTLWHEAMSQSEYNGINLDAGHYVQAGNRDVIAFIQKNHARITSVHLKDITYPENGAVNKPWGQGDTPIKEILQLAKKERYPFPIAVELEYAIPEGSDAEKEVIKCVQYAKDALA